MNANQEHVQATLVGTLGALLAVTAFEGLLVGLRDPSVGTVHTLMATSLAALATIHAFAVPLVAQAGWGLLPRFSTNTVTRRVCILCAACVSVGWAWLVLAEDAPLGGRSSIRGAFAALALATCIAMVVFDERPDWARARRIAGGVATFGAITLLLGHPFVLPGLYPTVHASAQVVGFIVLQVGLGLLARDLGDRTRGTVRASVLAFVAWAFFGAAVRSSSHPDAHTAREVFADLMQLGLGTAPTQSVRSAPLRAAGPSELDPLTRFHALTALPDVRAVAASSTINVLLVTIEALRYDATGTTRRATTVTPHLDALAARGLRFERAFAPSSGTLLSMASMHGMTYPSQASIRFWSKHWHGDVLRAPRLAAEEARDAGLFTFWVGHDHHAAFSQCVQGLDRGFQRVTLVPSSEDDPTVDDVVSAYAVSTLGEVAGRRFFGWVFLSSPHAPYLPHDEAGHAADQFGRYLEEVRYADAALGRILDTLTELGLDANTLVIVTGDHGEEFGEHGGIRHRCTVYDEQVRVPLVLRGPGIPMGVERRPTSGAYLLAWAFADLGIGRHARRTIEHTFLPMLENTDGAVLVELLGPPNQKTALVFEDHKLILNERSGRMEWYDLASDPAEATNLSSELGHQAPARLAMARQWTIRNARRNYSTDARRRCHDDESGRDD